MYMYTLLIHLFLSLFFCSVTVAQECSATNLCATGCCSQYGFCGTDDAHCGDGCLSTCDYKLGCDANNPCASGCCSKYGFCGLGPDFCSEENCVAGCGSKAYCDPGNYGSDFVEVETCPLNVCCSQYGFCGTTEEFCGNKTVTRPSCSADTQSLQRVVGYYESWAPTRSCQAYQPEDIPVGVYSHLNFAFAGIDPETFAIVPSSSDDTALYTRLTDLKQKDPNLQVFIAIGGWSFNDPGPTATTFSDIAASQENQVKFIQSLITFLATYNFDGVDIDWEYPAADDRSGRAEDFENYVNFVANLRSALDSTSRNGLSITVPVSYWYLQNFDIAKLINYVDFFNVMSYDLHGIWDKGNEWLGNYLNAHTNMTEISQYLDLFWRNDIDPSKMNLGLAFYSRTFTVSDTSCVDPQCLFDSAGDPGPCTQDLEGGTLSLAEIDDMLASSTEPVLDEDAMIKWTVQGGNRWIAYDDEETWALKIQAVLEQCFGGVMVWAVSQDIPDTAKYSLQLAEATGWQSPDVTVISRAVDNGGSDDYEVNPTVLRPQCTWSDCGEQCPVVDGVRWTTIWRADNDGGDHGKELMTDSSNCPSSLGERLLCCPPDVPDDFSCGWWSHNGGWCDGTCPTGYAEVGSNSASCKNGGNTGRYQAACCTVMDTITHVWGDYYWYGDQDACGNVGSGCESTNPTPLFTSWSGSGAVSCYTQSLTGTTYRVDRPYCQSTAISDPEWTGCGWFYTYGAIDTDYTEIYCSGGCPDGMSRIALKDEDCQTGASAYCCSSTYRTDANEDEVDSVYADELDEFYSNPTCPSVDLFSRYVADESNQTGIVRLRATSSDSYKYTIDVTYHIFIFAGLSWNDLWNNHIAKSVGNWPYMSSNTLQAYIKAISDVIPSIDKEAIAFAVACDMDGWNTYLSTWSATDYMDKNCDASTLASIDPDTYAIDDEDGNLLADETIWDGIQKRGDVTLERYGDGSSVLVERGTGGTRNYFFVFLGKTYGPWTSQTYPNGENGAVLAAINGDSKIYSIAASKDDDDNDSDDDGDDDDGDDDDDEDCTSVKIKTDDPNINIKAVTEHIVEIQSIPRYMYYLLSGILEGSVKTGLPNSYTNWATVDNSVIEFLRVGDSTYNQLRGKSPLDQIMNMLGSKSNPDVLVNCDAVINNLKAKLWKFNDPLSAKALQGASSFTVAGAKKAMARFKTLVAVWKYLNQPEVNQKMGQIYEDVAEVLLDVQEYLRIRDDVTWHLWEMWQEYMVGHTGRMATFTKTYAETALTGLSTSWQDWVIAKGNSITPAELDSAWRFINMANDLLADIKTVATIDETLFSGGPTKRDIHKRLLSESRSSQR